MKKTFSPSPHACKQALILMLFEVFNCYAKNYGKITKPLIFFYSQCPHMFLTLPSQVLHMFLRTARSFYDSLWYLHTYILTYLRTYLRTSHLPGNSSYTKTPLPKSVPNDTSSCSKFFLGAKIQKMTKIEPKTRLF